MQYLRTELENIRLQIPILKLQKKDSLKRRSRDIKHLKEDIRKDKVCRNLLRRIYPKSPVIYDLFLRISRKTRVVGRYIKWYNLLKRIYKKEFRKLRILERYILRFFLIYDNQNTHTTAVGG